MSPLPPLAPPLAGARRYDPAERTFPGRVLVVDNYDSFTFNLVQYLLELGAVVDVVRNDAAGVDEVLADGPSHLLLSPGPGRPEGGRLTWDLARALVREAAGLPVLGVCLGHQAICAAWGATVGRAERIMHGKTSPIVHDGTRLFRGIPSPFEATRYHSLIVDPATVAPPLRPVATTERGELMAVAHEHEPIYGVQFHPESVLSACGHRLLGNFLGLDRSDV